MNSALGEWVTGRTLQRRAFLRTALGLGAVAASELLTGARVLGQMTRSLKVPGALGALHFAPKAKRVINLYMLGGVSQIDTFDYKPLLEKMHGQEIPPSVKGDNRVSTMVAGQSSFPLIKSISPFKQYGQSGRWVSDLLPHTAKIVDDLCFVTTVNTPHVNHDPASKFLNTGFQLPGRPSQGAWISYGLGSENQNLPAFVVFTSQGQPANPLDTGAWSAGFLPSKYQGVPFRSTDDPVLFLKNTEGMAPHDRREWLQLVNALAGEQEQATNDTEIASKISQYEMAFRMQTSVPEIANIDDEPPHILEMYGPDVQKPNTFARNCLLARRLAERDVRFISLIHVAWDDHFAIAQTLPRTCQTVDQPVAALVTDRT